MKELGEEMEDVIGKHYEKQKISHILTLKVSKMKRDRKSEIEKRIAQLLQEIN